MSHLLVACVLVQQELIPIPLAACGAANKNAIILAPEKRGAMKVKKIEDSAITDSAARNSIFLNIGLPPSLERLI
jgi:hypothetical protein